MAPRKKNKEENLPLDQELHEEHKDLPKKDEEVDRQAALNPDREKDQKVREDAAELRVENSGDVNFHKDKKESEDSVMGERSDGSPVNMEGDNSRHQPATYPAPQDQNEEDFVVQKVSTHSNPNGDNSRAEPAYYERVARKNAREVKASDLPKDAPDFLKEHYKKNPEKAARIFNSSLGMKRRRQIDEVSLAAFAESLDRAGIESSFVTLMERERRADTPSGHKNLSLVRERDSFRLESASREKGNV